MDSLDVFVGDQAVAERRGTTLKAISQGNTTLQEKLTAVTNVNR